MFLNKTAQSTAEYAIVIGLVIAVVAGVMQVALKHGIQQKGTEALNYLSKSGVETGGLSAATDTIPLYNQEYRQTTVDAASYVDKSVMKKGGSEERTQTQKTSTTAVSVETVE